MHSAGINIPELDALWQVIHACIHPTSTAVLAVPASWKLRGEMLSSEQKNTLEYSQRRETEFGREFWEVDHPGCGERRLHGERAKQVNSHRSWGLTEGKNYSTLQLRGGRAERRLQRSRWLSTLLAERRTEGTLSRGGGEGHGAYREGKLWSGGKMGGKRGEGEA